MTFPVKSNKIEMIFWGIKQGHNVKSWKKRLFVLLKTGELKYFENETSPEPKGCVQLLSNSSITYKCDVKSGINLLISGVDRNLLLVFTNLDEMMDLKQKIENFLPKIPYHNL